MSLSTRLRHTLTVRRARTRAFCHWCDRSLVDVVPVAVGGYRYCSEDCATEDSMSRLS